MVWTDEMRAKASATRLATKQKKEAARLRKEQRNAEQPDNGNGDRRIDEGIPSQTSGPDAALCSQGVSDIGQAFDWETCPLTEAINKQAEMKREYERISAILLKRQNPNGRRWTCYTEEVRLAKGPSQLPRSVLAQCLRTGDDGKWKFRDDGRFVIVNGVRTLKPAFCCNSFCFSLYQDYRTKQPR